MSQKFYNIFKNSPSVKEPSFHAFIKGKSPMAKRNHAKGFDFKNYGGFYTILKYPTYHLPFLKKS